MQYFLEYEVGVIKISFGYQQHEQNSNKLREDIKHILVTPFNLLKNYLKFITDFNKRFHE